MAKILTRSHGDTETGRARAPREPWPRVKLGDVCEVTAGSPAPQEKKLFEKGTHPFIRTSDVGVVHVGHINSSRDKLNEEGIQKLRLFPKGSVLFPKSGASTFLNHRVLLDVDAYVVSHLAVIIPSEKVAPEYLLCHLATVDARDLMQDVNYPALRTTEISNIEIPLPPLSVQCEIVARVERELGAVEKVTKAFEELERAAEGEFKAELKETFEEIGGGNDLTQRRRGAEVRRVRLGDVCDLKNGYTPPAAILSEKGLIPYFRISAMNLPENSRLMIVPTAYCTDATKRCYKAGSIVFPKNGGAIFTRKVRVLTRDSIVDLNTGVMTTRELFDRDYAKYWFEAIDLNKFIVTGTIPFVDFNLLNNADLVLPSLTVQRRVVARLDAARLRKERLVAAAKKGKAVAALWRKAILKEAFA